MSGYRHWLRTVSGGHEPSDKDISKFKDEHRRQRVYGSILGLIRVLRLDGDGKFTGTRSYLAVQGFDEPSPSDLAYFHRRVKIALIWRVVVGLALVAAAWAYLWWAHLLPFTGL